MIGIDDVVHYQKRRVHNVVLTGDVSKPGKRQKGEMFRRENPKIQQQFPLHLTTIGVEEDGEKSTLLFD